MLINKIKIKLKITINIFYQFSSDNTVITLSFQIKKKKQN